MPTYELPDKVEYRESAVSGFAGVDFTSDLSMVAPERSPDALNMTFSKFGAPVKRGGIKRISKCPVAGISHGIFTLQLEGVDKHFHHCGTRLYAWDAYAPYARTFDWHDIDFENFTFETDILDPEVRKDQVQIYGSMADRKSYGWQVGEYLYILDGSRFLRVDKNNTVQQVTDVAYIPTTRIGAKHDGTGGKDHEAYNLLSPFAINTFLGDGTNKVFNMSSPRVQGVKKAEVLNVSAEGVATWTSVAVDTLDAKKGTITLVAAPPAPVVAGEDNVRITFKYTEDTTPANKVTKCRFGILWNIHNGDSLVLSGNPDSRNHDYTSAPNDPTYFPDTQYSIVGSEDSAIVGFALMNGYLIIFKSDDMESAVTYAREVLVSEDYEFTFTTREAVMGLSALSQGAIADFAGDTIFISTKGVMGLAQSQTVASRYTYPRSTYINRKLLKEAGLMDAMLQTAGTRLYLFVDNHIYVADKDAVAPTEKSGKEYEWLYWEAPQATCTATLDGDMVFGDGAGYIYRYKDGTTNRDDYMDYDFKPIRAYWTTSYQFFDTYSKYKTLKRLYVLLVPFSRSHVDIYTKKNGGFKLIKQKDVILFDLFDIDFNNFSFNTDSDVFIVYAKIRQRKVKMAQFRFENKELRQPFGLIGVRCVYMLNSYVKR